MLNDFKNVRLSALLAAVLAVSTAVSVSKPARGENVEPSLPLLGKTLPDGQPSLANIKVADFQQSLVEEESIAAIAEDGTKPSAGEGEGEDILEPKLGVSESPETVEESPAESVPEAGEESPAESGPEPGEESPAESGPEAIEESPAESGPEPIEKSPAESGPEPTEESPAESGPEPTEESPAESGPEPIEESPAESGPEAIEESPAESGPEAGEESPAESGPEATEESPAESVPEAGEELPFGPEPGQELPFGPTETPETGAEEPRVLVAEVVVSGVDQEFTDLVYETINTEAGRTTTRSRLQEDVNAIYATGFFANVTVTPEDTPLGVRITFTVQTNPILEKVVIETAPAGEYESVLPPEVAEEIFSPEYGKILNLRDFQEAITKLNQWYTENGYDLAQVVGSPQVEDDGTVTLVVAEGLIEKIEVRFFDKEDEPTDGKTRDFIVTREVQLKPGDVFNRIIAQFDLQRVFSTGIFEDVRLSFSPGEDPSTVIVNMDVVESSTGSVAAGAGVSSTSGFFGTLSFQQQNIGGNNQTLATEIQLGTRELLFDISFTDPWIGGDPYRTSYTLNAFRRRSISLVYDGDDSDIRTFNGNDSPRVVRTGGGITFARPLAKNPFTRPDWNLSAGLEYQHVAIKNADGDISPRSTLNDGNQKLAFSSSGEDDLFFFKFGASRDRRNNPADPTRGYVVRLGMDQTAPIGSGSILMNRLRGSFSYYIPTELINFDFTEGPQAFAFNVQAGTVLGDLPPYEAFVIGGSNSVRGYREGELGSGRSYFQITAEYRFPIYSIFGGALFVDYGSTLGSQGAVPGRPGDVRGLPGSGVGYGGGVRIQSPLGPLRIDYAVNSEGNSRIHFGIGQKF